ncbi:hypothetical protein [Pseudonocardia adelaidensis]|uniref:Uncharacterized protein n=1 Tax=Pseudonocardia adelaidensis TaxID=648754 RepID=A0ABP9NEP0_9PSEU
MAEPEPDEPAERSAVESARPSIGRRDEPDAIRPDTEEDRPHRTLPPGPEEEAGTGDEPDAPRPAETPAPEQ